ncbi:uncharacterized protein N7483_005324 [Penicillium malachiteum]|uniref:uncharacterized protein n=1 Tax=Penicillium malachiteum TaxID=1324776 RepID=UPI0025487CA1|nr:uncharacterized protein N7483_005324 [Penicillium malachiteum]KAJ5730816.1 hypothetical protein N7483_005324 [Penicillium malachiteum]
MNTESGVEEEPSPELCDIENKYSHFTPHPEADESSDQMEDRVHRDIELFSSNITSAAAIKTLPPLGPDGLHHFLPEELEELMQGEDSKSSDHAVPGLDTARKFIAAIFATPTFLKNTIELCCW